MTGAGARTGGGWGMWQGAGCVAKAGAHQYMALGGRPSVGHMKGMWGAHKTCLYGHGASVWARTHWVWVKACKWGYG